MVIRYLVSVVSFFCFHFNAEKMFKNNECLRNVIFLTLNVGLHPNGLMRAAWNVQKFMRAYEAR